MDFTIVVPVKDEYNFLIFNLPRYYQLKPSELIVVTDKPCPPKIEMLVNQIADNFQNVATRLLEVAHSKEWVYHQAHVRRAGFKQASQNRILTGDIDLHVYPTVLSALRMVGCNDVGLCSLGKIRYPYTLVDFLHEGVTFAIRKTKIFQPSFTGLYALWKPYWLDSEDEYEAKRMTNPKQVLQGHPIIGKLTSEDRFLRQSMQSKHHVIRLRTIGALDFGTSETGFRAPIWQYLNGSKAESMFQAVWKSFLHLKPYYLKGYVNAH